MATRTVTTTELLDDLDGSKADATYLFSVEGTRYEIDLNRKNGKALEKALKPYLDAARKVRPARSRASAPKSGRRKDLAAVRAWGKDNGFQLSDRGRVAQEIVDAYDAAH